LLTDPPLRPEEAAAKMGMGYEAFRKRFARLAGIAPAKYRDARLMDLAGRLLRDREKPLKQIADACGFCDELRALANEYDTGGIRRMLSAHSPG
jgi:AraC-like DNA-binding protein